MLNLEIVTPEKKVFDEAVDAVTIPTTRGEVGILDNHAPIISTLMPGILSFTNKGTTEKMVIAGGFVEVSDNKVSILADTAELATDIDIEAAKAEQADAQKVLGAWKEGSEEEFEIESQRLQKANAQLQLASGR